MKKETFTVDLLTPCICGGADPKATAEIRPASIRGQLRWWFRTLGGFVRLEGKGMSLRDQECMIFGSAGADDAQSSNLVVRVVSRLKSECLDAQKLGHKPFSGSAYLTFPMQSRESNGRTVDNGRALILGGQFTMQWCWRGPSSCWPDLLALAAVFGELGSLGFRGRRAMGALAMSQSSSNLPDLRAALERFRSSRDLHVFRMNAESQKDAISKLGVWLRGWRAHGRTQDHARNLNDPAMPPLNVGFAFAKNDHDIGYNIPGAGAAPAYRPALGLPIIQRTQNRTNHWNQGPGGPQGNGRFASPILLRPHREAAGNWSALIMFVDAHRWPDGAPVFLNGQQRAVSTDLYDAMKRDAEENLQRYP